MKKSQFQNWTLETKLSFDNLGRIIISDDEILNEINGAAVHDFYPMSDRYCHDNAACGNAECGNVRC